MAASRARWLVTASRTGRGGKAEPALLKWTTLATPGVSDLRYGTSSGVCVMRPGPVVMTISWSARGGEPRAERPVVELRLGWACPAGDVALKAECILRELQVHPEVIRADGLHLG